MKYVAEDGKVFDSMNECMNYEKELNEKNKTYWEVVCNGSPLGSQKNYESFKMVIAIPAMEKDSYIRLYLKDWCYENFGSPLLFTNSAGIPQRKYSIHKSDKENYENETYNRSEQFAVKTKFFCEAEVIHGYLRICLNGFYGLGSTTYKNIRNMDRLENDKFNIMLSQYKHF